MNPHAPMSMRAPPHARRHNRTQMAVASMVNAGAPANRRDAIERVFCENELKNN